MTLNLTGINKLNEINLTGKMDLSINPAILIINKLKKHIVEDYIVPLFSKQWGILNQNTFLISDFIEKLKYYNRIYKLDDLHLYIELLKIIQLFMDKHNLLIDTESQISGKRDPNDVITMVYKTTALKLLPEYEIYNSIIGKPNRNKNQLYNEDIINDIKYAMSLENISYNKIKEFIEKKYLDTK
jgi:hypothetical protein